jgi:DNA-binding Xre family transcriptional regulator
MDKNHVQRKTKRSAAEKKRLREIRDRFQRERPTCEELAAEPGGCVLPLGVYLDLQEIAFRLKQERQRLKLSLADVSAKAGIDKAALSRLENGKAGNPTVETLSRVAWALGKRVVCSLEELNASR